MHRIFIAACFLFLPLLVMSDTKAPFFRPTDGACWSIEQKSLKYGRDALTLNELLILDECFEELEQMYERVIKESTPSSSLHAPSKSK